MDVYVQGTKVPLRNTELLGQGGEAEVYRFGVDRALKVFKAPNHPDYQRDVEQQRAAEVRLELHQEKLRHFPGGLPAAVVAPEILATDRRGHRTLGYVMRRIEPSEPLLRYGDVAFRIAGISNAQVFEVFRHLHQTLVGLHGAGVVVGDLNDANILIHASNPYLIDSDSFQFGPYLCRVFTERFVDPLQCDPNRLAPVLNSAFSEQSDWYAFSALLLQSLFCVGPHGGVYRPKDLAGRIPPAARPLRRITVFHPEVQYPKPARPLQSAPDELLHHLHAVFVQDLRTPFPKFLLDSTHWSTCPSCGLEHARSSCPVCAPHASATSQTRVIARGEVRVFVLAEIRGVFVHASAPTGVLEWVAHERGEYRRENGQTVRRGPLDPTLEFATHGRSTFLLRCGSILRVEEDKRRHWNADSTSGRTAFQVASGTPIWVIGGQLVRQESLAPFESNPGQFELIGSVLEGQTRFWSGRGFGFGFYRAGNVLRGFVFATDRQGINDRVQLPHFSGSLVEASCAVGETTAWTSVVTRDQGQVRHHCWVVTREGRVSASAEGAEQEEHWFSNFSGACVVGEHLFVPTDAGILRVGVTPTGEFQTKLFPDTEPFVDSASRLVFAKTALTANARLCIVNSRRIVALEMK